MKNICYLINGRKYYDEAMLRERVGLGKSSLHALLKNNLIGTDDIKYYQNRLLVSLDGIKTYIVNETKNVQVDKIKQLSEQRKKKYEDYQATPSKDWKKMFKKFELDIIDLKIKMENLKRTHT